MTTAPLAERPATMQRRVRVGRFFHLGIGIAIAVVVLVGFGRTVDANLIHPPSARPWILYAHTAIFSTWVLFFITQAALIDARRVKLHRRLGVWSLGLATAMLVAGVATAVIMTRFHDTESGGDGAADLAVPLFDMLAFATSFGFAMLWRFRPEHHRRLMLMASCGLTAAAFARFPHSILPRHLWYVGVDALILVAAVRDLVHTRHLHPVYLYGLPLLVLGQALAMWLALRAPPVWLAIAHAILG
jgi:hypothetical protein